MALPPPWIALYDAGTDIGVLDTGEAHKLDAQRLHAELVRRGWDIVPGWAVSRWRMDIDLFGDHQARNETIVDQLREALLSFDADQARALDLPAPDRERKIVRTADAAALLSIVLDLLETYGGSRV